MTLSNGTSVRGCFFISGSSRTHTGPEGVKDVLNSETGFFPFERSEGMTTILYNRDHVIMVELHDSDELRRNPGYDVAIVKNVMMLMSNGARLHGAVHVFRRQGSDRLSDFVRAQDAFQYLEADRITYIINLHQLVELAEETAGP